LFLQQTPPAQALRRFGLTHWAAGNPRAAGIALATAAAIAPGDAALWSNAAPWFSVRTSEPVVLRVEANAAVHGGLLVFERRES
jgi:hypothetical protein